MLNVNLAIATKIYKLTSALNLDEFIQYYRKHKGERELDIFTPQDVKTLCWSKFLLIFSSGKGINNVGMES